MDIVVFESCDSTWVFAVSRMRFCRIPKGIELSQRRVSTEWHPYSYLELDPRAETFSVYLTPDRSRVIRSWSHSGGCVQCGADPTTRVSLEDARKPVLV
jgi:hypothetical protein